MTSEVAAVALTVIGFANVVGTYIAGESSKKYRQKNLLSIIYLARALLIVALMIPISLVFSTRFVKPIHHLIRGAQAFGAGNLDHRLPVADDEIGELAGAFNQMAGSIQHSQSELEQLNLL